MLRNANPYTVGPKYPKLMEANSRLQNFLIEQFPRSVMDDECAIYTAIELLRDHPAYLNREPGHDYGKSS